MHLRKQDLLSHYTREEVAQRLQWIKDYIAARSEGGDIDG